MTFFWLKFTFWMTLCPSSQILTGEQTYFLNDPLSVVTHFHSWPNSFFIFLNDPLNCPSSFVTHFDWWPNLLFEWPFVRRHTFSLTWPNSFFIFLNDPKFIRCHTFGLVIILPFWMTLCPPSSHIFTHDQTHFSFFWMILSPSSYILTGDIFLLLSNFQLSMSQFSGPDGSNITGPPGIFPVSRRPSPSLEVYPIEQKVKKVGYKKVTNV